MVAVTLVALDVDGTGFRIRAHLENLPRQQVQTLAIPVAGGTNHQSGTRPSSARDFYSRVLGGTPDKAGTTVVDHEPGDTTSIFLNLRLEDLSG
ncbi:hypothetical protein Asi02nite_62010 [Asanoa siamensis]|uniref:Uncharacterized protein n=1 Tax=Asanoa siamensis TaxID=926357 RepID=A0ABQ4CZI5_9ACTN|nr:hypothetical protein Asi02nite_62010 [Asanoa siamensis]